jgi:hypothetical protein
VVAAVACLWSSVSIINHFVGAQVLRSSRPGARRSGTIYVRQPRSHRRFALTILCITLGIYLLEPTRDEILDLLAKGLGIPVAVLVAGWFVSDALKEKDIRAKYVELAIIILRDAPQGENSRLRAWAAEVLSRLSLVPLPEEV